MNFTEDETFNKLRRLQYKEMFKIWSNFFESYQNNRDNFKTYYPEKEKLLNQYGWTTIEFDEEYRREVEEKESQI